MREDFLGVKRKGQGEVNIRKWVYLFMTTLGIGAAASVIAWMILQAVNPPEETGGAAGIGYNALNAVLAGTMFSILSQMGFFAYLTMNYIARSIIRRPQIWVLIQAAITALVLTYVPVVLMGEEATILEQSILSISVLAVAALVAAMKVKLTNSRAFIPTIFFMAAVTMLEAIPAIRQTGFAAMFFMIVPLLACNAWQILILGKLVKQEKSVSP